MWNWIDILARKWLSWRTTRAIKSDILLDAKFKQMHLDAEANEFTYEFASGYVGHIARELAEFLGKFSAGNYVEVDFVPPTGGKIRPVRVTVQYADGMSPAEKNKHLELIIKRLESQIDVFQSERRDNDV